jgi:aspartyl-tRNA(Asn)/glutamyl-tRNA(Gln) amidotransferase subunit C
MDVKKIAKLSNLTITKDEEEKLSGQFEETIKTVEVIEELETNNIESISQVTGLSNIVRDDLIDKDRMLNIGNYFKVKAIFNVE